MTQAQSSEEKAQLKVQWTRLAIDQALASQWEEAVTTNRNILNIFPNDAEAYNRLGKALSELGRYSEARQAYNQTLKYSPNNTIAKKNLDRLSLLQEEPVTTPAGLERIDPRLFIEETGKTGTTDLIIIASLCSCQGWSRRQSTSVCQWSHHFRAYCGRRRHRSDRAPPFQPPH